MTSRAQGIVEALRGRWMGIYGLCLCPAHDDGREPALKISDDPNRSDSIDVICFAGCDWQDVKAELRRRGLLPEWNPEYRYVGTEKNVVAKSTRFPNTPKLASARDDNPNRERALAIWHEAKPAAGTVVEHYLQSRGITIPTPSTIRCAHLRHAPTGLTFPVMAAAVTGPDRDITGIHRTYLKLDGSGKAAVTSAKMMLGRCSGGAVHLGPVGEVLIVGEGIESTLSVQQATGLPGWAAMSTSGLVALRLPALPLAETVFIAADNFGRGIEAGEKAAGRLLDEGRTARIAMPQVQGWDFNDLAMAPKTVAFLPERRHG